MAGSSKGRLAGMAVIAFILWATGRAEAQFIVTLENPTIQATTVSDTTTETFDGTGRSAGNYNTLTSSIGTYSAPGTTNGITLTSPNQYGGSNDSHYVSISGVSQMTLTLASSAAYFGFEWLAGDPCSPASQATASP